MVVAWVFGGVNEPPCHNYYGLRFMRYIDDGTIDNRCWSDDDIGRWCERAIEWWLIFWEIRSTITRCMRVYHFCCVSVRRACCEWRVRSPNPGYPCTTYRVRTGNARQHVVVSLWQESSQKQTATRDAHRTCVITPNWISPSIDVVILNAQQARKCEGRRPSGMKQKVFISHWEWLLWKGVSLSMSIT